ncbi:hypothetical protein BU52_16660 [Streptomyces toyocaensis]|uniref:Uncharacterized protein n=1 Tax=Streptomyces toyocaensis TaxID=55952 RepID=A0A081XR78_STRTO|nr:hypothetical protein [Streptomyces toyocaensis]KES06051.1 hypothetical protein BU52_16660 [Streptomyces toyocaensis]
MSERNTAIRSLHDLGLAAWFGGSLMGAVGLNGAAQAEGGTEVARDRISSAGWSKWTPVNAAAIGAHLFGGGGLLAVNAHRVATQQGVAASTTAKTVVTAAALAATAYARILGKKVELASSSDPADAEKAEKHPIDLDTTRRQLAYAQWAVPALTGCLVVLNALHGEQQRPIEQMSGMWERARSATHLVSSHRPTRWSGCGR